MITNEIAESSEWKEEDIRLRNENVADRACKVIISPLERNRKYQSKNVAGEFAAGI